MTKNTTLFNAQQIAQQGKFANQVHQKKQAALANSESVLNDARFDVSSTQALDNTLVLLRVLAPLLNPQTSHLTSKNPAAARRAASGRHVGTRKEAMERFANKATDQEELPTQKAIENLGKQNKNNPKKTEEVDFEKIVEELLKSNPERIKRKLREERISKELSQRRQNLPAVNQTEIKEFIEEQKASNPNQPVDFSCYSGRQLVGSTFEVRIPGTSDVADRLKNVVSDLDVHGTNFFKNINVDGCYFLGGNFSGCRFGDTIGVTFDGSDLTNADMSKTKQTELLLGGSDYQGQASKDIDYVRKNTKDQQEMPKYMSDFFKNLILKIAGYEKIDIGKSTKFVNIKLEGATLKKFESRYLTDFEGTEFEGVALEGIYYFDGKNVKLNGAILKTSDGQIKNITNPITPEEIAREATPYVAAMLQNNVLTRKNGKTTTIALSRDCIGKAKQEMIDKGLMPSDATFLDPTEEDFKKILDLYNRELSEKFNVRFIRHEEDKPYDYFISFCHLPNIDIDSAFADGPLDWTNQGKIGLGNHSISQPLVLFHEMGHILGADHPFRAGIKATKCSLFASIMCYESALDIMVPLDNLSKYPARISPSMLRDLGIQDKSHYNLIFGKNPDYQEQDITTNLKHDQIRIIDGDKNFKNIAHIDTTSLPKDIRYAVLDAKEAIGTCFKFPCDPKNIAEGIDEGTLVVFYTKNQSGGDEISGVALLYGGRTNNIFIDGKEVIPKRGVTAEPTPTSTSVPKPAPTSTPPAPKPATTPSPTVASITTPPEISSKSDNNLIGPLVGSAAALLIIMVILALKNRSRNNYYNKLTELTEFATPPQVPTNSDDSQHSQLGINAGSKREDEIETPGETPTTIKDKFTARKITGGHYSQRYSQLQGEQENFSIN